MGADSRAMQWSTLGRVAEGTPPPPPHFNKDPAFGRQEAATMNLHFPHARLVQKRSQFDNYPGPFVHARARSFTLRCTALHLSALHFHIRACFTSAPCLQGQVPRKPGTAMGPNLSLSCFLNVLQQKSYGRRTSIAQEGHAAPVGDPSGTAHFRISKALSG